MERKMKEIPGYEGHYLVSDDGMVFCRDRYCGLSAMSLQKNGRYVRLSSHGHVRMMLVSRLVLEAFGRTPVIMHRDGDLSNNNIANLFWSLPSALEEDLADEDAAVEEEEL